MKTECTTYFDARSIFIFHSEPSIFGYSLAGIPKGTTLFDCKRPPVKAMLEGRECVRADWQAMLRYLAEVQFRIYKPFL